MSKKRRFMQAAFFDGLCWYNSEDVNK